MCMCMCMCMCVLSLTVSRMLRFFVFFPQRWVRYRLFFENGRLSAQEKGVIPLDEVVQVDDVAQPNRFNVTQKPQAVWELRIIEPSDKAVWLTEVERLLGAGRINRSSVRFVVGSHVEALASGSHNHSTFFFFIDLCDHADDMWYSATVTDFDAASRNYQVSFDDGSTEWVSEENLAE
jgi:hypothetical protein